MTMLDDEAIELRLRAALHDIVQRDLAEGAELRGLPVRAERPAHRWVRPTTIAAALVLVAGLVALVLALRDDRDGSTVVVDRGNSAPVRLMPGVLPDGVVPVGVFEQRIEDVQGQVGVHGVWVRREAGTISGVVLVLAFREMPPSDSLSTRRTVEVDGRTVWVRSDEVSEEYVTEHPSCGVLLVGSTRVSEPEVLEMVRAVECADGSIVAGTGLPAGFTQADMRVFYGERQVGVVLQDAAETRRPIYFSVIEGMPASAPFLREARPDGIERIELAGRQVDRVLAGETLLYRWTVDGVVVLVGYGTDRQPASVLEPTAEEIEAIIASVRAVSEAEWDEWLVDVDTGASSESEESSASGNAPATTVPG